MYLFLILLLLASVHSQYDVQLNKPATLEYGERLTIGFKTTAQFDFGVSAVAYGTSGYINKIPCQLDKLIGTNRTFGGSVYGNPLPYKDKNGNDVNIANKMVCLSIEYQLDAVNNKDLIDLYYQSRVIGSAMSPAMVSVGLIQNAFVNSYSGATEIYYWIRCKKI